MPKYLVSVTRTAYSNTNILVEAKDPKEAESKALASAGDIEFPGGYDTAYTVEGMIPQGG
jgi:hypothetical protein